MQAVCFVMGFFFASGSGVVRCGFFCHGMGILQWQLYAVVFLVRGGLRKCRPFVLSRCFFLQAVLVPCGAFCFVVGWFFPGGSCTRLYLTGFVLLVVLCGSCVCCSGRFA